ncbi:MAG: hypothetical protein KY468_21040 [Armatimonadetes bacterium]|nr:hypothetical protein [Armatimonadota bacterium]
MQKTIVICEGCRNTKTHGKYFSLAYKTADSPVGKMEDYCSEGCLLRRLSMILSQIDNGIVARCEIVPTEAELQEKTPKPILLQGTG